jgi:hypothetical protein
MRGLSEIPSSRVDVESRLEDWLADDISMIDDELLTIGRQVQTDYGGYIDLLCVDPEGDLVVLELKRAKTPREVTAQALDYASWVVDLNREQVVELAENHLMDRGGLDTAFRERFDQDVPETLNGGHRMVIVGTEIDPATERIVQYLSDTHGVSINVVTFQFFTNGDGEEFLARDFLLQPENVEYRSQSRGGKRRSRLTPEQLQEIADRNGIGDLYAATMEELKPLFKLGRRSQSIALRTEYRGKTAVMVNLIPTQSDQKSGLQFQAYTYRLAEVFGLDERAVRDALPKSATDWEYTSAKDIDSEWRGVEGCFGEISEVRAFRHRLEEGHEAHRKLESS